MITKSASNSQNLLLPAALPAPAWVLPSAATVAACAAELTGCAAADHLLGVPAEAYASLAAGPGDRGQQVG